MFWHRADFWCCTCTLPMTVQGRRKVDGSWRPRRKARTATGWWGKEVCWDANEPKCVHAGDKLHQDQRCDLSPDTQTDKPGSLRSQWKEWASPFALFQWSIPSQSPVGPVVPQQVNKLAFGLRDDYLSCLEFPSSKYNISDGTETCSVCMIHRVNRAGSTQLIMV